MEEPILDKLLSTYKQIISQISPDITNVWIQTNFDMGRLLHTLKICQTLLCIEIHTRGTKYAKTPYTDFFNLTTSLCLLPSKFVIENDPYRDFACLKFVNNSAIFEQSFPLSISNHPEMTIDEYYKNISLQSNDKIFMEMMDQDSEHSIYILYDIHKFELLFGFPHIIAQQFAFFSLDCYHPLLDRIIDSGCILSSSPNKSINELLQINFGFKLTYHKLQKCPNYDKLPVSYPKSFKQSVSSMFWKHLGYVSHQPINNLYKLYYENINRIIKTFTDLLQELQELHN